MVNSPIWVTEMVSPTIAAIDVGTNAIRMVVGSVNADRRIDMLEDVREPVRLGQDVFTRGSIAEDTTERVIEAFQKFKRLIDKDGVEHVKAVATSATREAQNSDIFCLIHCADFADRYERQILPILHAGYIVLADRYIYTAFARNAARGCDRDWIRKLYS